MRKKSNSLNQEILPLDFPALDEWPIDYYKHIIPFHNGIFGVDIETEGLIPYTKSVRILSVGVSPKRGQAFTSYTKVFANWDDASIKNFVKVLENPKNIVIGHNIKYDINWLRVKWGVRVRAMLFDTQYAQYLLDENRLVNSLESLVDEYIPELSGYKAKVERSKLSLMAPSDLLLYNGRDADSSRRLFDVFIPKLKREGFLPLMNASMEVLPVLSDIEARGIYLDQAWADKERTRLFNDSIESLQKISEMSDMRVDPESPISMQNLLYKKLNIPVEITTEKGSPSTGKVALKHALKHVQKGTKDEFIIREILAYRRNVKLLSTYYNPIREWTAFDGRVHTTYRLGKQGGDEGFGGTVTGRLSSDNPNLQQIPIDARVRGMYAATNDYTFFDGDYSQLELRVAAFLAQEPVMMDAFGEGLDIHTKVMSELKGIPYDELEQLRLVDESIKTERVAIKRVNFGILYGVQAKRLQELLFLELGIVWDIDKCETLIRQWLSKYKKVAEWIRLQHRLAVTHKEIVMPFGQKRRLPDASWDWDGQRSLRQATNFPVQSTASWICLIGVGLLDKWLVSNSLKAQGGLLLQVHDSIGMELQTTKPAEIASKIQQVMERDTITYIREIFNVNWNVPLEFKVTYGERWK